jgi:hypothetical protein
METTLSNFENQADELNFSAQADYFPGPGNENDDDSDDNNDDDKSQDNNSGDDNPPLDEEVVHSPLTTQDGGKPK